MRSWKSCVIAATLCACEGTIAGPVAGPGGGQPGGGPTANRDPDAPRAAATGPQAPRPPSGPDTCAPAPARVWRLTPAQYARTVGAALGVDASGIVARLRATIVRSALFSNDAEASDLSQPNVEEISAGAAMVATSAVARPERISPCLAKRPWTTTCVRDAISGAGERLYRRPLASDEVDALAALYDAQVASGADTALRLVVRAMLMSTSALFRSELGADGGGATATLTPFERADAISYFITDGPPDAELYAAAKQGHLGTRAEIEAQARRLLASPDLAQGLRAFFGEHLGLDKVPGITKDAKKYPQFGPELAQDMVAETQAFVDWVLWKGDGRLETLLTSNVGFVDDRLARLYGVADGATSGDKLRQVTMPAVRAGLVTQASFLAVNASPIEGDPVRRGRLFRQTFLCQKVPDPPPNIAAVPPAPSATLTIRERFAQHTVDPTCKACHDRLDPIGFALAAFDAIGAPRANDNGKPIDGSGVLIGTAAGDLPFASAVELARAAARTPDASECIATRLYTWALGHLPGDGDACAMRALVAKAAASGGDVRALALAVVTADDFFVRSR